MMPIARLFAGQSLIPALGGGGALALPAALAGVARDSRTVRTGEAYVASGRTAERARHRAEAHAAGAAVIVAELEDEGPGLASAHPRWAFARASAAAHGLDLAHPPLVAVTGTAGKSTTTHCAWWAMGGAEARAARVGTIGWHDGTAERANAQTTPPPEELHRFLAGLPGDCPGVALEASSHAGDQQRLAGLRFAAVAFTGLGRDHLDYHRTLGAYLQAKLRIFRWLAPGGLAIVNAEDAHAHTVAHAAQTAGARVLALGFAKGEARIVKAERGWRLRFAGIDYPLPVRLPGDFNAWNAAAGALMASATGVPLATALARLATLPAVPGRLELLARGPDTFVDYAHTPEEIAVMLRAVRREFPLARLVCVYGCGGDRDRTKRGPMGCAALEADLGVLTTDNSRSEEPRSIAQEVIAGLPRSTQVFWAESGGAADLPVLASALRTPGGQPVVMLDGKRMPDGRLLVVELDRARAIRLARALAGPDGVVVVAGKGHETSQIIKDRVLPWDDRAFVAGLEGGVSAAGGRASAVERPRP